MRYLVMECGLGYAVVLDGQGRFLTVANLNYEVGQTVESVVLWKEEPPRRAARRQWSILAASAACVCLVFLGTWQFWRSPVGTVRMQINPDVEMTVNRMDRVIALEGLNQDGRDLIDGYRSYGRKMEAVSDDLADRAVEMGYLQEGGQITLTVESGREEWRTAAEEMLLLELDIHLAHTVQVTAGTADTPQSEQYQPIVIDPAQLLPAQPDPPDSRPEIPAVSREDDDERGDDDDGGRDDGLDDGNDADDTDDDSPEEPDTDDDGPEALDDDADDGGDDPEADGEDSDDLPEEPEQDDTDDADDTDDSDGTDDEPETEVPDDTADDELETD